MWFFRSVPRDAPPRRDRHRRRSDWWRIGVLLLAGVVCAMQIGKVPPALSLLRADLGVDLVASAWILSMFSAVGALSGSVAGASRTAWEHAG